MTNIVLLNAEIEKSGLTPNQLCAIWGVSLPTFYKLKNGESEFTAAMISASARAFGLTRDQVDAIFFDE